MDQKRPYVVTSHQEYEIGRFTIVKDTIQIAGKEYPYSYEKAADCACVLPVIGDDVILIRQYRHSLNEWLYEIPAGGLEGDSPKEAAGRELAEETGYVAEKMIYLGACPISQGTSTAKAYLYAAACKEKRRQKLDATELIETKRFSRSCFEKMIETHEFSHMAGIAAWHLYQAYLRRNEI